MSPGLTDVYYELKILSRGPTSSERRAGRAGPVAEGKPRGKFQVDFALSMEVDGIRKEKLDHKYERFYQLRNLWHGRGKNQRSGAALDPAYFPELPTKWTKGDVEGKFEVEIVAYYPGKIFL